MKPNKTMAALLIAASLMTPMMADAKGSFSSSSSSRPSMSSSSYSRPSAPVSSPSKGGFNSAVSRQQVTPAPVATPPRPPQQPQTSVSLTKPSTTQTTTTSVPSATRSTTTTTTTTTQYRTYQSRYINSPPVVYGGMGYGYHYSNGLLTGLIIGNMMHPHNTVVYTGPGMYSNNALLYPDGRVVNQQGYLVGNFVNGQFVPVQNGQMVAQSLPSDVQTTAPAPQVNATYVVQQKKQDDSVGYVLMTMLLAAVATVGVWFLIKR